MMKTSSVIVTLAMIMVVINGSLLRCSQAQPAYCLDTPGGGATFSDATTVVYQLLLTWGPCCQTNSKGYCTVLAVSGTAAASICGNFDPCPRCADVGSALNVILAQCNQLNFVEGVWSPDNGQTLYYLTADSSPP